MRTLLVSIPDNKQAEQIVRELAQRIGLHPYTDRDVDDDGDLTDQELISLIIGSGMTLDAMVARPVLACHCGATKGAGHRTTGYAQSSNFKWWVHAACNRPTAYIVKHWIPNMMNGARDLLHDIVPNHTEVRDHLDRQTRFRVGKQTIRDSRQYTNVDV